MTFADPSACPDCASVLDGGSSCPHCHLDLTSDAARQLWAALRSADAWLEEARRHRVPVASPVPAEPIDVVDVPEPAPQAAAASATSPVGHDDPPTTTGGEGLVEAAAPPAPAVEIPEREASSGVAGPGAPAASVSRTPRRRLSVGTVLLTLGALSLVVSAIIFIAVYWGPMGILGRAAVLLAVTALIGGFAVVVTRRGLRGSAEALWSVFLSFLSLDWLLSRDQGLFGLDTAPAAPVELAWAAIVVVLGTLVVGLGRRHLPAAGSTRAATTHPGPGPQDDAVVNDDAEPSVEDRDVDLTNAVPRPVELVAPSVLAGLAVAFALTQRLSDLADVGLRAFWALALVAAVSLAAALLLRRVGLRLGAVVVAVAAGLLGAVGVVVAYGTAVTNPAFDDLVLRAEGLPLALVALGLFVGSFVVRSRAAVAGVLAAAGTLSAVVLVTLPVGEQWLATGVLVLHATLGLLLVLATAGSGPVRHGVRWAAAVPVGIALVGLVVDAVAVLVVAGTSVEGAGSLALDERIEPGLALTTDAWRACVVGLLLAATTLRLAATTRTVDRTHALTVALLVALGGAGATTALLGPTALAMSAVLVAGGLVVGLLGGRTLTVRLVLGATLAAAAPLAALGSWWATAIVSVVTAGGLALLAARVPVARWRDVIGGVAAGWALSGLLAALAAVGVEPAAATYVLTTSVLALLVVAVLLLGARTGRVGVEVAAAAGALVALDRLSATLGVAEQSVVLLAAGAVLVALSHRTVERWWYAVVGTIAAVTAAVLVGGGTGPVLWEWAAGLWPVAAAVVLVASRRTRASVLREVLAGTGALLAGASVLPPVVLLGLPVVVKAAAPVVAAGALAWVVLTRAQGRSGSLGAEVAAGVLAAWGLSVAVAELPLPHGVAVAVATGLLVVALAWRVPRRSWYALLAAALAWSVVGATLGSEDVASWAWPVAGLLLVAAARPLARWWRDGVAGSAAFVLAMSVLPLLRLLEADDLLVSCVSLVTAAVAVAVAHRVLGPARGGSGVEVGGGLAALVAVVAASGALAPVTFAVVAVLLAALATTLAWLVRRRWWYALVGAAAAGLSVVCSVGETSTALWAWPAAAAVVAVGAARVPGWWRQVLAGLAAVLAGACVAPVADSAGWDVTVTTLSLVAVAAVLAALAVVVLRTPRGGPGVEVGAALLAGTGVLLGAESTGPAHVALLLTVVGAATATLSLLGRDRGWYRWIGAVALAVAYVLRLVASDVGTVEAYTLPFGVLLLVAGVVATRRSDSRSGPTGRTVVTLGPGLLLCLAPSLPLALADPTSLRALLLGLAALAVVAAGIVARWQAPFVAGSLVVAAIVLTNVGPYAWGLPRWVLIAVAGAAMLVTGVTWERRVQDGRAAVRWVGAMR